MRVCSSGLQDFKKHDAYNNGRLLFCSVTQIDQMLQDAFGALRYGTGHFPRRSVGMEVVKTSASATALKIEVPGCPRMRQHGKSFGAFRAQSCEQHVLVQGFEKS